jgi:hypothetical protein
MTAGGARPRAGRKPGKPNRTSELRVQEARQQGRRLPPENLLRRHPSIQQKKDHPRRTISTTFNPPFRGHRCGRFRADILIGSVSSANPPPLAQDRSRCYRFQCTRIEELLPACRFGRDRNPRVHCGRQERRAGGAIAGVAKMPPTDPTSSVITDQLTRALGEAVIRIWSNLPQDVQNHLFQEAVSWQGESIRSQLAVFLHDEHSRTSDPLGNPRDMKEPDSLGG